MTELTAQTHSGDGSAGPEKKLTTKSNGFFSVDRSAFRCAAVGGLNSAIAHLLMARGTGRDNRTTQWSVHSIEQRTGISRPNAAKAVKDLLDRGIWRKTREDDLAPIAPIVLKSLRCGFSILQVRRGRDCHIDGAARGVAPKCLDRRRS
jgi:hypothetical protein